MKLITKKHGLALFLYSILMVLLPGRLWAQITPGQITPASLSIYKCTLNGTQSFHASPATGPEGQPISYSWEISKDSINWSTDNSSCATCDYKIWGPYKYIRQKVSCGTQAAYTNTAVVNVISFITGGIISAPRTRILVNTSPGIITLNFSRTACFSIDVYNQLQKSTDNINWTNLMGGVGTTSFDPGNIATNTYFRCLALDDHDDEVLACTNTIYVKVVAELYPELIGGSITTNSTLNIMAYEYPGKISATNASGGNCTTVGYAYIWQKSTNGYNFKDIAGATQASYEPGPLDATTYFRRKVICGDDSAFTDVCKVLVTLPYENYPYGTAGQGKIYTRVRDAQIPLNTAADLANTSLTNRDIRQSTQYFDGLGNPLQTVIKQGSLATGGTAKDLVSSMYYDIFGRERIKYLPYASGSADGSFKTDPFTEQKTFYDTHLSGQGETYYYAQTNYEASVLGRVEKQLAPGNSWVGAGKGVESKYWINTDKDSVRIWKVTDMAGSFGACAITTAYAASELHKGVTVDEHGKQVVEFKDKEGRVILKKVQLIAPSDNGLGTGHGDWLCTYYIYDDLNRLRCVIQPEGVKALAGNNWQLTTTLINEQCFRYEYDYRNRMTMKKVPGAGEVYMVYDQRDRLVMTQDANLRKDSKWLVTLYENNLNRPVKTGLYTNATSFDSHRSAAQNSSVYPFTTEPSSNWELLTETHYDDYNNIPSGISAIIDNSYSGMGGFVTSYNISPDYAQEVKKSDRTKGMVTWTRTKALYNGSTQYLASVMLYDDKGRVIQIQSQNITGGTDVATTQYNWAGKPLRTHLKQVKSGTAAQTIETLTTYNYDDLGRVASIKKKKSKAGITTAEKIIVSNEYDALGQLKKKKLAPEYNSNAGLETLTYDYNIRGWMLGANRGYAKSTATGTNYFGFDLGYDKMSLGGVGNYAAPQYNGNIAGTLWKSKGDNELRKYDFTYDAVNRLTGADFNQYTNNSFNKTAKVDFTVSNLTYDHNGNIQTMNQVGLKGTSSIMIDQLNYTYQSGSNKLSKVTDAVNDKESKLGDFKYDPATKGAVDYTYDDNGNLTTDANKNIQSIAYNYLNLPQTITTTKGIVTFTYDAAGNKLQKTVLDKSVTPNKTTTTLYLGGAIFENDTLQLMAHEEGRVRQTSLPSGGLGWAFDYFLKDHLGNVRMVLTDEQKQNIYPAATLEGNINGTASPDAIAIEKNYYDINPANVVNKSEATGITDYVNNNGIDNPNPNSVTTSNSGKLYKLQAAASGGVTGLSFTAKVMSGDKVSVLGKSYYFQNNSAQQNYSIPVATILTGLLGGVSTAGKATLADLSGNGTVTQAITDGLQNAGRNDNGTAQTPKAYINYILFDEQFKAVKTGFSRVGSNNAVKDHYSELKDIPVEKNGYLYVYVSNESPVAVYFDNLQVTHTRGPILEENSYYPSTGLTMAGISSRAASFGGAENKKRYNGIEQTTDLDLNQYDAYYRTLDPQTGRWWQTDPETENMEQWSPYALNYDNGIRYEDYLGNEPDGGGDPIVEITQFVKSFWNDGVIPGVRMINTYVNPLTPLVELATGRNQETDFSTPKSRAQSGVEAAIMVIPGSKIESVAAKALEKTAVKGTEKAVVKGLEKEVSNITVKGAKTLPALDRTGKVHGILPQIKDLSKYSKEELKQLHKELNQSVQRRIKVTSKMGRDRPHGQRQGAEQDLIKSIEKYLKK